MLVLFTLLPGWGYVVGVFCLFLVLGRCFFFLRLISKCVPGMLSCLKPWYRSKALYIPKHKQKQL